MTVAPLVTAKEENFLKRAAKAVRNNDLPQLRQEVVIFSEMIGMATVERLLDQQLPLILEQEYIPRLLQMMLDGEDYNELVKDLLAEMTQVLASEGLEFGVDFSYSENADTSLPTLVLSRKAFEKARDVYSPFAWKQALSYLRVLD